MNAVLRLLPIVVILGTSPAFAHGDHQALALDPYGFWNFDVDIYTMTAVVLLIYLVGLVRRYRSRNAAHWWRHLAFLAGVALVFLALESPIDPLAERAFWMHQIQHLLLRMAGPMLIMLAGPETTLLAGVPRGLRRGLVRPMAGSGALQLVGRVLSRPIPVFLIFLLSLVVWEIPALHNAALQNNWLHYVMHVTMLLAGLVFFHAIFDRRLPPASLSYTWRHVLLLSSILTNIMIGAFTALKVAVWYHAYDIDGRLFTLSPLSDEQIGGFIIWVPGSMMLIVSIILTIYAWNLDETKRFSRRDGWVSSNMSAIQTPQTAEELWIKVEKPNKALAIGLGTMTFSIFALLMSTMIVTAAMQ